MDVREVMTPRVDVTYLTIPVHAEDIAGGTELGAQLLPRGP